MLQDDLAHDLLDNSKDLIWMVDTGFNYVFTNKSYLDLMKELTGVDVIMYETVFEESFDKNLNEKWKTYYERALKGEYFEIEEHYHRPEKNETLYYQITFEPIINSYNTPCAVACRSRDITRIVKQKTEEHQLLDASLDVFCTINEQGNFVYVSAAAQNHWGYHPDELVGMPYEDLILSEDVAKTNKIAADIINGIDVKSFDNRYKKKDGSIAYNYWSARWDDRTKLMYAVARDAKEKIEQEEKMLQSEQRFKALVQEGSDLIAIVDTMGNFNYVSPSCTTILGITAQEFIGKNTAEFVHPADLSKAFDCLQKLATQKRVELEPVRFQNHKKEWRWMQTICTNLTDNPAVNGIVINSRDITEAKNLKELHLQTSKLAKIGSWEVDLVNQTLYWSDIVHHLHETDPKTFVPDLATAISFYREDFRQLVQENVEKCIANQEPYDFEAVIVTTQKKELWVRATGNAEFENGICKRIYGSFQDINDRKESENRLISLSENIPGVIYQYVIYPDGTNAIQHVSGGIEQLWGYTKEEVMESIVPLWNQIELGGSMDLVKSTILASIETKSKWTCRYKIVKPNGELRTHLGNATPSFLADGSIVFNVIIIDITQEAKNEDLLKQASEMSRIGSWELDLINQNNDGMYWSSMMKEILEVDDNFHPTLSAGLAFYIGENKEKVHDAVTNLINEGIAFDEEILLLTEKGNKRWIRIIGNCEMVNHKRTRIYGSIQDIDDRKIVQDEILLSKEKAQESEAKFMAYTEQSSIAIYTTNVDGDCVYANKTWLGMTGLTIQEALGKGWINALHIDDLENIYQNWYKSVESNGQWSYQYRFVNKVGNITWVEGTAKKLYNNKNEFVGYLGTNINITERKKAEESLLLANERFEKVTEATNDAIWDWDIVNQTIYRSKAYERFFGKDAAASFDVEGFWKKHFHPDELQKNQKSIFEALENPFRSRWELEYKINNELGETLYIIDRGLIIRNNEGKAIRMVGAMTDITEQKRMNVQLSELNKKLEKHTYELERSNEELEQFAFVASHDLQEPLRMVTSFMNLLEQRYGELLDEKARQYIYFATDGAKRMKNIILDLLEYSRANKSDDTTEEVNLSEIIAEYKLLRRKLISETKTVITDQNLPTLTTYKAAITQVFHCLVDNAIKYSVNDTSPIIAINAIENDLEWQFSIKDNGIGIDAEFFNKIFVIFQRLHNANEYSGTGIGLSITKRHVEFLGGRIWLDSIVGEGSTFYFTLPKNQIKSSN